MNAATGPRPTTPTTPPTAPATPSWRQGTARPLLWLLLLVAAAANVVSTTAQLPIAVNLVTGVTVLGAVAGLIALRRRDGAA